MTGWVVAALLYAVGALGVYQYQWRLVKTGGPCQAIVEAHTRHMSQADIDRMLTTMFAANAAWWPGYVLWIARPWFTGKNTTA